MILLILVCGALTGLFLALSLFRQDPHPRLNEPDQKGRPVGHTRWDRYEAWLVRANLPFSPHGFTLACLGLALGSGLLAWKLLDVAPGVLASGLTCWVIRVWVLRRIAARGRYVAEELPQYLRLMTGSLRTGFSLMQCFEIAIREGPPLIAAELQRVVQEVNMGASLEAALERMALRIGNDDVELMVTAMLISREVGGNLGETLSSLAETVQQRGRLRRQIRVLTAQSRISGLIVAILPFVLLATMFAVNREFTSILFRHPLGYLILATALVSEALGIWLIRKIIRSGEAMLS
jgi:tight adherence protein B